MNGLEVEVLLKSYEGFIGVFARNKIPSIYLKPGSFFIFNTHPSDKPGEHWIAVYVPNKNVIEHFDPLGQPPSEDLQNYYTQRGFKRVMYSKNQIQHNMAITCGLHCVIFIKNRIKGLTMSQILTDYYTCDPLYNECIVLSEFS